jgi:hypothetical protein
MLKNQGNPSMGSINQLWASEGGLTGRLRGEGLARFVTAVMASTTVC